MKVGTRIPGVIEVATIHGLRNKIFAAVHHDTPCGMRVVLQGTHWDEWIVGCADPEATAARLAPALRAIRHPGNRTRNNSEERHTPRELT